MVMIPITWEKTFAASSSVSISDGEPDVGDSFTVTIYYSGDSFGSVDGALTYDPSVLRYESSTTEANGGNGELSFSHFQASGDNSMAITFYFTVVGSGDSSVTAYSSDIYNYDGNSLGGDTAAAAFTAGATSSQTSTDDNKNNENKDDDKENDNKPKSSNANLSQLSIACGEITPAFSPSVTSYSVTAGPTETDVDITAIPEDDNAYVEFGGSPVLTEDQVTRVVTVVAEDGTKKEYSIKITRSNPDGAIVYDGRIYTPSQNQNISEVPAGFLSSKINYSGKELNVLKSRDGNVNIIRLVPEGGSDSDGSWFVFNPENQSFAPSEIVTVDGNKYVVVKNNIDLVYGGPESSSGYQIYDAGNNTISSLNVSGTSGTAIEPTEETPTEPTGEGAEGTGAETETTPTETKKKGKGILWFILLLILALIAALLYFFFRDKLGNKNKSTYAAFDDEEEEYDDDDDDNTPSGNSFLLTLAGLKEGLSSKLSSKKSNDSLYEDESGMSERRIERRRRIAEAEARNAAALASGSTADTDTVASANSVYVDTTPISEGSVVTKAELEAAKIAAAEKAREEANRAMEEAKAAQEAAAAAIAARDAARAAKARVASSELDSAMEELLEVGEELHEAVNGKDE